MLLKRVYNHAAPRDDWTPRAQRCDACQGRGVVINAAGTGVEPCPAEGCEQGTVTQYVPPVRGVELLHAGPRQRFSPSFLDGAAAEGWLRREGAKIILTRLDGDPVTYQIVRTPGSYCCHCEQSLDGGDAAKAHVHRLHAGVASPDPANPAGYFQLNAYDCTREG